MGALYLSRRNEDDYSPHTTVTCAQKGRHNEPRLVFRPVPVRLLVHAAAADCCLYMGGSAAAQLASTSCARYTALPVPNRLLDNDPVMIVISVLALAFYLLAIIASLHLLLSAKPVGQAPCLPASDWP